MQFRQRFGSAVLSSLAILLLAPASMRAQDSQTQQQQDQTVQNAPQTPKERADVLKQAHERVMVRRKQRIRFDALGDDAAERLPSREPSPQQVFNDAHFDADVQQALDTLAPEFRAAVVLCDIEGLSYEEIAATLGVKLGTVRSRIHRGRSQLRKALAHRSPEARAERRGFAVTGVPALGGGGASA